MPGVEVATGLVQDRARAFGEKVSVDGVDEKRIASVLGFEWDRGSDDAYSELASGGAIVTDRFAEDNDLDWTALQKIYSSKTERQALLDHISRAFASGIASTPTFIVNGQIMGFGPDGTFTIEAIKSALGAPAQKAAKPAKK